MKQFLALILALCLCIPCFPFPAQAADSEPENGDRANSWRYSDGERIIDANTPALMAEPSHPDATLFGVDVSHHQGKINWESVRAAGVKFAILRCGYGMDMTEQDDACFAYNAAECERLGIPYGVYIYSYATTVERASSEADHVLRLINGRSLSYPVYYDMEDDSTLGSDFAAIAKTFCDKISAAGYPVGVYANLYWWNTHLTDPCFDSWYRWVAQHNTSCEYTGEYAIWQYSNNGYVNGINGYVDVNYQIGSPADHGTGTVCHTYVETVTEPACTAQGYTTHTCTDCGNSYTDRYVGALGHSYEAGACLLCGEKDPDYALSDVLVRLYGTDRCETARRVANELKNTLGVEKFEAVLIASGDDSADALSGSYLAALKNAPVLLHRDSQLEQNLDYIRSNLNDGGTVYILGGDSAVPETLEAALEGFQVKRLGGATRFETNLAILEETGVSGGELLVCTGYEFADSLSASAAGWPILLVNNYYPELKEAQKAYLETLDPSSITIIGGESAVSKELAEELAEYASVRRLGGNSRFETSVLVAETFFEAPDSAVLAYGWNFPDGLCGGVLASVLDIPLILTTDEDRAIAADYAQRMGITHGIALGGPTLISDDTAAQIFGFTDGTAVP